MTHTFNAKKTGERIAQRGQFAQMWLGKRVIQDSNEFVPMDTGLLASTVIGNSNIGRGLIVYATKYAKRLYYGVSFSFSKDKHPKATHHWFEKAKSIWLQTWIDGVRKIMGGK